MGSENPFEPPRADVPTPFASPEVLTVRDAWASAARLLAELPLPTAVFMLLTFIASLTPAPARLAVMLAAGALIQPFELELWAAHLRGRRPDQGRALARLPMAFAMSLILATLIGLGLLLLLVPGVYLMIRFAFVACFIVLDGQGWSALAASHDLARGRGWTILGITAPTFLLGAAMRISSAATEENTVLTTAVLAVEALVQVWVGAALTVLFLALSRHRRSWAPASVSALRTPAAPR
jgi:hypothetical protein